MTSQKGHKQSTDIEIKESTCADLRRSKASSSPADDLRQNRRGFCGSLVLSSLATLAAAEGLGVKAKSQTVSRTAYPLLKIEGAEALMPGSALYFNYPRRNDPAILVRSQEGEYYAYSQRCSHLGCSVYFDRAQGSIQCPCHGGAYDCRTGFAVYGPPKRPIDPIYLQMRRGGEVWAVGKGTGGDERIMIAARSQS